MTDTDIMGTLRHDTREISDDNAQEKSFDASLTHENWDYSPNGLQGSSASARLAYLKERVGQLPHMNRKDLVRGASWCIHLPDDIPRDTAREKQFFEAVNDYLNAKYGAQNCYSCVVHRDERNVDGSLSRPHMHYKFIPVASTGRISYYDTVTRTEYRRFHPELKKYLESRGIRANVNSGITRQQGGNKTTEQIRSNHAQERSRHVRNNRVQADRSNSRF